MLKHHIRYMIRRWWPMLLILSLTMGLIYGFLNLVDSVTATAYHGQGYAYTTNATIAPTLCLLIVGLAATFVMSLFVFTYRTRKQSADVFYQAAYAPTTIKRVRMFIGLGILIIALTAAFLTGFLIYLLRFISTPEAQEFSTRTVYRLNINLGGFFIGYLVVLLVMTAQYFINCFLVSLGNYFLDQLFLLVFGNVLLCLCVTSPMAYILLMVQIFGTGPTSAFNNVIMYGLGPVGAFALDLSGIEPFTNGKELTSGAQITTLTNAIVATGIHIAFGAFLGVCACKLKDPSGEFADVAGARNKGIALIPHGAALTMGILVACFGFGRWTTFYLVALPFFLYSLFGVVYYVILALWRHSFKLKRLDLMCFLIVIGVTLTLLIVTQIAVSVAPGGGPIYN